MKVEFELIEKSFTPENGNSIKYYVLQRKLVDGNFLEFTIKGDKAKLLLLSLAVEKNKKPY